ncbi:MAG: hypothetical protein JRE47_10155 [Deltaproteobacteria bacterium]|nr:hypothetical protein [Deltaproteobacteria bacterium]
MKVEIYDSRGKGFNEYDRYTIIIGKDIYTMSDNPNPPQGACIYHGTQINMDYLKSKNTKIDFADLPESVQAKINSITQ